MKINPLVISMALLFAVNPLRAQQTRSAWHSVQGLVVDDIGKPAAMATVYLKDAAGHRLRMKQADRNGRFNFGFVNTDNKYEIYAEQATLTSPKLPIMADESKREIVFKLVLSRRTQK